MASGSIFTIGYAGFSNELDAFIAMLKKFNVNVLIDVRSNPHSGYYIQYNMENLDRELKKYGIYYRNYSSEFGARQEDQSLYPEGYLDFDLFSKTDAFLSGVSKIEQSVAQGYSVVFMCAEKDPIICHRTILVSRAFSDRGYEITHILPDGTTKTQTDIEYELLNLYPSYFCALDNPELDEIKFAYKEHNKKIAFELENL